jgi:hypothetical protein
MDRDTQQAGARLHWWQTRGFVIAVAILSIVPLLWPALPPLSDLPGHVGRYRILAEAGRGPLAHYFAVQWAVIGNLGVDLLVVALHPLLDVEPAAKLVVMAIPLATVLAMLWLAREVHGRVPPAAGFALPIAYGWPFQLGFVNFCLAVALVFAALALWLRLARWWPAWWRALLFVPVACVVWICHSFGWAMLGLFALGIEWRLRVERGERPVGAAIRAGLTCAPMALPMVLSVAGVFGARLEGASGDWFNIPYKLLSIVSLLRERWQWWDLAGVTAILLMLWAAVRSPRIGFAPLLGIPALMGIAVFAVAPRLYQSGAYVDMRIWPASVALALLAIRLRPDADVLAARIALLGTVFFVARTVGTTAAFAILAQGQSQAARAIDALPVGGATLVLVNEPDLAWSGDRLTHIGSLAIARRRGFTNTQWALPGQQLARPIYTAAAPFDRDPTQLVYPLTNTARSADYDDTFRRFDRCAFDHVWTLDFPPARGRRYGLPVAWTDGRSTVYAVPRTACVPDGPRRR